MVSLLERIKGKTEFQIHIMNLKDIKHTLVKNEVGKTNTQNAYCLTVLGESIKYFETFDNLVDSPK